MLEYKDLLGQEIRVGDYITYAAVDGRSGVLRLAKVIKLVAKKTDRWQHSPTGDEITIPKIQIRGWSNFHGLHNKLVTLEFLDRMIVIPANIVPKQIKDVLDQ